MKIAEYIDQDAIQLAIAFGNRDFLQTLRSFFNQYNSIVESISKLDDPRFHLSDEDKGKLELIEKKILEAIDAYFNGFPAKAYRLVSEGLEATSEEFSNITSMNKNGSSRDYKRLYRLRKSTEVLNNRKEIFHIPFSKRRKVPSCRFSIPGLPALYLGTSIYIYVGRR